MSPIDYTGAITIDEWQEYHNLKANFHRYTECYAQEQQTLLARIDDLQIANVRLQDKLLIQEQQNKIYEQRYQNSESVPGQRSLNRRASLYDGSWTNSLQSTMVSPFPPTIFSPTVSLTKSQKPSLAISIPNSGSLSLSTNSSVFVPQQTSITVEVEPTSWSSSSPVSMQWQKRDEKIHSPIGLTVSTQQSLGWVLDDVPFSYGNWADSDFDDDSAPPPGTAVSAPAGSIPVSGTSESVRYAMVLVDVCNVKFPVEDVLRGREGGYQYIENLHRAIIEQLATQNLPPVTDPLMVRMIVKQGDYGNLRAGGCEVEQMDEFCLGMRTHTSSMPIEQIPNERFKDTPSALLSTLRMCLNDEDCQLVLIAIDHSLPVYLDDLRTLSTVMSTTKMMILGNISTFGNDTFTCLNIGHVVAPASIIAHSLRQDEDEGRWLPPTYSAVAKIAPPHGDRSDSKTPLARHAYSEKTDMAISKALSNAVPTPRAPQPHVVSEFQSIQNIKREFGHHPCAQFHLEGYCPQRDQQACTHLHEEITFSKVALDRYRRYVHSQPCPRGVTCRPGMMPACKLRHTCPWGNKCSYAQRKDCIFDAHQFQGQGHRSNVASKAYRERGVVEEQNSGRPRTTRGFDAPFSGEAENLPNLSAEDFQPMLIVITSMNQSNGQTRQLRARVNELIQARFPGIYPRLGIVNFKNYSTSAEAAGLVEMGKHGEGRDWIALTQRGKQLSVKK